MEAAAVATRDKNMVNAIAIRIIERA
jgi:hypothetical protein